MNKKSITLFSYVCSTSWLQTDTNSLLPSDVLQGDGVLHSQLVGLALNPGSVHQDTRISRQPWKINHDNKF